MILSHYISLKNEHSLKGVFKVDWCQMVHNMDYVAHQNSNTIHATQRAHIHYIGFPI